MIGGSVLSRIVLEINARSLRRAGRGATVFFIAGIADDIPGFYQLPTIFDVQ